MERLERLGRHKQLALVSKFDHSRHVHRLVADLGLGPYFGAVVVSGGRSGGQSVFHAHMHVIPRFADEPYAGRGMRSWIKEEANRRRPSRDGDGLRPG